MWLNLLERGILYYSRETRCIDQPACPSVTWEGIFWNMHTVKLSKFAECVLKRTERKLQMQLLFALVSQVFFLQRNMFHACDSACRLSLTQPCHVPALRCPPEPAFPPRSRLTESLSLHVTSTAFTLFLRVYFIFKTSTPGDFETPII